ncbi:MAG TPA: DNA-binding protein WhiA [Erysipelotrichaceae bacterium]|nr:DNA-binding protein WhiA [Erysipelotrichaceae bacterium]
MRNKNSFTSQVKEELINNPYPSSDRLRALLSAYIRINGSLVFRHKKTLLRLITENAKIGGFIYKTINDIYSVNAKLIVKENKKFVRNNLYIIEIIEASEMIMDDLEISFLEGKISKNIVKNDDTISGYLAGAFLAAGSINSPITSNYHLEIALNNDNYAKWLAKLFAKYKNCNIEPKITKRREEYVIYFKKSDQISNFLIMIGAVSSCLEFENIRANRDLMNNANRLTNMDTANMKRTIETGSRQAKEIAFIDKALGIDNLSSLKERELCKIRLANESASLQELADLMSETFGTTISKSNVNHLFRSIHALYERLSHDD